jgi:hypothetical protein
MPIELPRSGTVAGEADVFISYASADRQRVLAIADRLAASGVSLWLDRQRIDGATCWAEEIVRGIKGCQVLLLMCSDAAMRSWAVKQEIQLAGEWQKALLPVMLEPVSFPDQVQFFLAGRQWLEVMSRPTEDWLPPLLRALARAGVRHSETAAFAAGPGVEPVRLQWSLEGLRALARFTDQVWPLPAEQARGRAAPSGLRDLGAPQDDVTHSFRLGSRVCLALEAERSGHLLLLDEGASGKVYCLCPSAFAPDTRLSRGRRIYPQDGSRYDAFVVSGRPGREQLLAIITDEPLGLDWMPADRKVPARVLSPEDIDTLLERLRNREGSQWTALSTWFDVTA